MAKFETVGSRARRDDAVERQRPQALPGLRLAVEERDPSVRQDHEARDSLVADACEKNRPVAKKFGEDVQDPRFTRRSREYPRGRRGAAAIRPRFTRQKIPRIDIPARGGRP